MKKTDNILKSLASAFGVLVYTSAVSWLIFNGENIFKDKSNFLMPLLMLLLLIISASITGSLVLGRPISLYLSGFKKEAFISLFTTLAWLVFFIIVIVFVIILN